MSVKVHDFSRGMMSLPPDHLVPSGAAKLIRNLYHDTDGVWKDICAPSELLDLSDTFFADVGVVKQWFPAVTPADAVDSFVFLVFYKNGDVKMVYR